MATLRAEFGERALSRGLLAAGLRLGALLLLCAVGLRFLTI